ncbi:MAG: response regulator [Nitrospirota bacterium]
MGAQSNSHDHQVQILVVEDDVEMRALLVDALTDEGYRVWPARDGAEAAAKLAERSFDLMITDMKMPQMDGMELLSVVKERGLSLPVIAISAFFDEGPAADALRERAVTCLRKPLRIEELKSIVKTALHHPRR